ncbi:MAG TPA: biopolymer transporter ExbD [Pyrinomonadaceae bacterium]|nr:biopolymer transporter ExbD [Pyrinomonadaceae bacterium]
MLVVVMPTVLTLITGCQRPQRPAEFKELVPERAEEMVKEAKESPLTIIVTIDGEYRVLLNDESVGTTEDVSLLKEKLAKALEGRKQAYRAGTGNGSPGADEEAGQKVVFVRAPSSFKYGEVVKVIEAIRGVGGEPIGLQEQSPNTAR